MSYGAITITTNLDQIGAEAIRLMTGADRDVKKAQANIKQVWDAYTAAEEARTTIVVNGAKRKTEWAKLINRSARYCQMIAKDGSRARSKKKDANRVRPMMLLKELITVVSTGSPKMVIEKASAVCDLINWMPPEWKKEEDEEEKEPETKQPSTQDVTEMEKTLDSAKKSAVYIEQEKHWGEYAVVGVAAEKMITFQRLRKFGLVREMNFPHYRLTKKEKAKELRSLFNYGPAKITDGEIEQTMHAQGFCWSYHPHSWEVRCGDMLTPMEVFLDDKMLMKVLDKRAYNGSVSSLTDSEVRKGLKSVTGAQGVSNFRATAAWAVYERYCPEDATVYDPSMGWGGRFLGAVGCLKVSKYVGCEPSTKTFEGLAQTKADLKRMMPNRDLQVDMHMLGSEDFQPEPGSVDVAFSSPPYFEGLDVVERYSDEPTQSHVRFPSREAWLEGFMGQTIRNCFVALKPRGTLALNVSDELAEPVTDQAVKNGFVHAETLRLRLSKNMGSKHKPGRPWKTEPVLVFKRKP